MSYLDDLSLRLGVPFAFVKVADQGCRALLMDGTVLMDTTLTPERAHWAYCHEVAHLRLEHHLHLPGDDAEEREQESAANLLASELLLPEEQFQPFVRGSLTDLRRQFPYASHEVLARRRLQYRSGLLTICDNGKMSARLAPVGWSTPARLFKLENAAFKRCLRQKRDVLLEESHSRAEATYVDEGRGVVRVILFYEAEEGSA